MRHNKKGRKLGTDYSHTKAMKRSLVSALFLNDRIKTVESRAKEIRPQVDKVITWAKRGDLHSRRLAIAYLNDKELVREIFEKVAQGMFQDRPGGYTRIMKLGPRKGDNAPMVIMELVTEPCVPKAERKAAAEKKAATKKAAPKKVAKKADKSEELAEDLGFEADGTVEAVQVRHGDMSPDGSGPLSFERGVEIGQVFQLGLKYSNALGLKVLDQNGKTVPVWMGSYGIGVSRVMACIAETHHDEKGLAWPAVIAPAQVHVVATGKDAAAFEAAEQLIGELEAKGIEVIFDDRKKVSPGVKFKDAELIGVPIIAVAGRDTVNNGTIEVRDRNGENAEAVPVADAAQAIADRVAALLK